MGYMQGLVYETAPSFSSSATPVVGYKADNSGTPVVSTLVLTYLLCRASHRRRCFITPQREH